MTQTCKLRWYEIERNGEEESMWTTIKIDMLVHVADPGIKALALLL